MADISINLVPETLFTVGNFSITNTFLVTIFISLILIGVFTYTAKSMKLVPKGIQFWVELFLMGLLDFMTTITRSEKRSLKMLPFIATVFLVFFIANFLPFIPGIGAISYNNVPLYRTATTDYSWIFTISTLSVILMQAITIGTGGFMAFVSKYLNFTGKWSEKPLNIFLGLMDIISEIAKIISLSFRLFGNIFAGEILAVVVMSLVPYLLPIPFAILSILTAIIQAAVFAILILIFMNMSVVVDELKEQS